MGRYDASVIVGLLREGAPDPSDDDVGRVVSGPDALLQRLLLDQCREESWVDERAQVNPYPTATSSKLAEGGVSVNVGRVLMVSGRMAIAFSSSTGHK